MPSVLQFIIRTFFTVGLLFPVFAPAVFSTALTPVINEAMISNLSVYPDESGGFTDWIELFNPGETGMNLADYGLSDDKTRPFKWKFPDTVIPPGGYLIVFASGRDTTASGSFPSQVIREGDTWKYRAWAEEPPANWNTLGYDDSGWDSGPSGFGYADGDDATLIPQTAQSVHIRKKFTVWDPEKVTGVNLAIDYDDAFVAYLNGVEVAREGIGTNGVPVRYDEFAKLHTEALLYQNKTPNSFPIKDFASLLRIGENVLAMQGHNSENSADLSLIPMLSLNITVLSFHTNFKLAAGETILLTDPGGNTLDRAVLIETSPDVSQGRITGGDGEWRCFTRATPGVANLSSGYMGTAVNPEFSPPGGFYNATVTLALSSSTPGAVIRYTLDCSEPIESSPRYDAPLTIPMRDMVRARTFAEGYLPSGVVTHSYFIGFQRSLPVVSLISDNANFFGGTGIYTNYKADMERPVHVEFFEPDGTLGFSAEAGMKIHGASSAGFPQKSLQIFARTEYGTKSFDYRIFRDLDIDRFEAFVLRNSGHDWGFTMFRDALTARLSRGTDIDIQAYRPSIVFLNGSYWGLHNIREKINEHYLASHHGVNPDSLDMMEYVVQHKVVDGDRKAFDAMVQYMETHDLSLQEFYDHVKTLMDVDQFIDYQTIEIYEDNGDWPGNNVKFWRPKTSDGKWKWILYDTDVGFGHPSFPSTPDHNKLVLATHPDKGGWGNYGPWSTFIIRNLLKNRSFRDQFINRMADFLNDRLLPERVVAVIDSMQEGIRPEMSRHFTKWGGSVQNWTNQVNILRDFARRRPVFLRQHYADYFGLSRISGVSQIMQVSLNVVPNNAGSILINTLNISGFPWSGIYFPGVPVPVAAIPALGYRFVRWEGGAWPDSASFTLPMEDDPVLTARFEPATGDDGPVVITEINYNSSNDFDPGDWVEIHNRIFSPVDLSGWRFADEQENAAYPFPEGSTLGPGEYLVLCRDANMFSTLFTDVHNYLGNFGFGLSGGGELIRLFDAGGTIVDSLTFSTSAPWPDTPDGKGATLALKHPSLDNSLYWNWTASGNHGTPGAANDSRTGVEANSEVPTRFLLEQNHPNPFNPSTTIEFILPAPGRASLVVYDALGSKVRKLVSGQVSAGKRTILWDGRDDSGRPVSSGVYFSRLESGGKVATKKMLLMK